MIKPLATYVALKSIEEDNTSSSGIILTEQEAPVKGKVLAVGSEVKSVKNNDVVLYKQWGATKVNLDREEILLIKEEDLLAIV